MNYPSSPWAIGEKSTGVDLNLESESSELIATLTTMIDRTKDKG